MAILIIDPAEATNLKQEWLKEQDERRTEVWEGRIVMAPMPNNEHQRLVMSLCQMFYLALNPTGEEGIFAGVNLSDSIADWKQNYRNPDVVVHLASSTAVDYDTHFVGGFNLVVEILSKGETPTDKLLFYEQIQTQEVLIIKRNPWALYLYTLQEGKLALAGQSNLGIASILTSSLGLTFQLVDAEPRPQIHVTQPSTSLAWKL
jgi:Uma2 family endonuclease